MSGHVFRVLYVCHANICRSPIAEHLLRAEVNRTWGAAGRGWMVESAGVAPGTPRAMDALAQQVLQERHVPTGRFVSRELTHALVARADLILTAERSHRSRVVQLQPSAIRRTFTIRQFARLTSAMPPIQATRVADLGVRLLSEALQIRASQQPANPDEDDLVDPVGRPVKAFRLCADVLSDQVQSMLHPLELVAGPPTRRFGRPIIHRPLRPQGQADDLAT